MSYMQDGNRKEFLIIVKTKKFINYLDKILVNISKKDYRYKDNLINISLELLSLYYQVNSEINNDIVKKDLIIIKNKLSMIDFYIELFFEKGYFEKSNVSNLCKKTLEIAKMTSGWEKYKFGNKDAEKNSNS